MTRGDIAYRVALVGDGVPAGPGVSPLQGQPEEDCGVERVDGRPALGAVAGIAGHSGSASDLSQHAGEAAVAVIVDGAWHAHRAAADSAGGEVQDCHDGAAAPADRPVGRQWVGLGGDASGHGRRARDRDERTVTAEQLLAQGREGGAFLGDCPGDGVGAAEVVTECEVDHTVGLCSAAAEGVQVGEMSP